MVTKTLKSEAIDTASENSKASARAASRAEGRIVETAQEARGAEPGPSMLALLSISTIAAGFVLAIVWFMFFRT